MKLSIVMAVYNEKDNILKVIEKIRRVEIGLEKEIIIVDGCSNDGTREILKSLHRDSDIKVIFEEKRKRLIFLPLNSRNDICSFLR